MVAPVVAKALAAFQAVELCKEMDFMDIVLEGSALHIVSAVKAIGNNWSMFGHIVDGIIAGLSQLRSWRIEHVKQDVNLAAHIIAKEAIL
jgi:hypothetical protein